MAEAITKSSDLRDTPFSREEIQKRIKAHELELRELGVASLELFGSASRDQGGSTSDIDLLVRFNRPVGFFAFFEVQEYLESLLECDRVDLVPRDSVLEELKDEIFDSAVPCL